MEVGDEREVDVVIVEEGVMTKVANNAGIRDELR